MVENMAHSVVAFITLSEVYIDSKKAQVRKLKSKTEVDSENLCSTTCN